MINVFRIALNLLLICVVILLPFNIVWSGDEELITPYSELDPETGFFVPKRDPTIEDVKQDVGISPTAAEQDTTHTIRDISSVSGMLTNKLSLTAAGIILVLLGGFIFRLFRVKPSQ